jgi:hypothetical protein
MAEYRRQTIIASAVAVIVALSIGLGVYVLQPQLGGTTTTGTSYPIAGETTNSSLGLKLSLSLSSSTIESGQNISVNITEYNVLPKYNNVSASDKWPNQTVPFKICNGIYPLRLGVVKGYYDSSNISKSNGPVGDFINPDLVYSCPAIPAISSYIFQPNSDLADMCFGSGAPSCYSPMSNLVRFNGTWLPTPAGYSIFYHLNPSVYTVIGGDEWGDNVILHFVVIKSSTLQTTTTTTTVLTTPSTTFPQSAETTNSTLGLELIASLNSTNIQSGQAINVNVSVANIRPEDNNVSGSWDWVLPSLQNWSASGFQCLRWWNFAIFKGYYIGANISQAQVPLPLFQPGYYLNCSAIGSQNFTLLTFKPSSSNVSVIGVGMTSYSYTFEMCANENVNGYYSVNQSYLILNKLVPPLPFPPGIYTLVAGNEWGQLVVLHFTVSSCSQAECSGFAERTFAFANIPQNFTLGAYSFGVSFQGMHTGSILGSNGSTTSQLVYLGDYVTFYVSNSTTTESVIFSWAPSVNISKTVPNPTTVQLFDGSVVMNCFENSTGSYVTIIARTSFGTTIQATTTVSTQTSTVCSVSAEPTGFYLHVITDETPKPIEGAVLNATLINGCGYPPTGPASQIIMTNSTGWAALSAVSGASGNFFFIFNVQYSNSSYSFSKTFQVSWQPEQGTFVTVSLPSGTVSVVYRFPVSCNFTCYYLNIPQVVTVIQSQPAFTDSIQLWTNNTLTSPTITNITLLTGTLNRTQIVEFYVPVPSYVFASPSFSLAPSNNGTLFYFMTKNDTRIPTTVDTADNLLYTNEQVQGWIEIYSSVA